MERQKCLRRAPRPRIWAILDQGGVIEEPVGPAEIMREQFAHLVALARQPTISIRVVPRGAGAHVGREGPFRILTVHGTEAVYVPAPGGGRLIEDASEIPSFRT